MPPILTSRFLLSACQHAHNQLRLLRACRACWSWSDSKLDSPSVVLWLPGAVACCCGSRGALAARLSRLVLTQRQGGCCPCRGADRLAAIVVGRVRPAQALPCQALSSSSLQACRQRPLNHGPPCISQPLLIRHTDRTAQESITSAEQQLSHAWQLRGQHASRRSRLMLLIPVITSVTHSLVWRVLGLGLVTACAGVGGHGMIWLYCLAGPADHRCTLLMRLP